MNQILSQIFKYENHIQRVTKYYQIEVDNHVDINFYRKVHEEVKKVDMPYLVTDRGRVKSLCQDYGTFQELLLSCGRGSRIQTTPSFAEVGCTTTEKVPSTLISLIQAHNDLKN